MKPNSLTTGIIISYSLKAAGESVLLRATAPDGGEPRDGDQYLVEFRGLENSELLETLDPAENRIFDSQRIEDLLDDLAEEYLRTKVAEWDIYVAQSGRGPVAARSGEGEVEREIVRGFSGDWNTTKTQTPKG